MELLTNAELEELYKEMTIEEFAELIGCEPEDLIQSSRSALADLKRSS